MGGGGVSKDGVSVDNVTVTKNIVYMGDGVVYKYIYIYLYKGSTNVMKSCKWFVSLYYDSSFREWRFLEVEILLSILSTTNPHSP